jgi:glyoxylase-like metal-dependent hydrolase (beta-lactamase superfamily II)
MTAETVRIAVGTFTCVAVADGSNTYPTSAVFADAPKEQLGRVLREHGLPTEELATPYNCLAIGRDERWVLVDAGIGVGVIPTAGRALRNLAAAGIDPSAVDLVLLTHGHRDHAGGCTDAQGNLIFTRARHIMWKDEWEFWTAEDNLVRMGREYAIPFVRSRLLPLRRRLDLIDRDAEVLPGVKVIGAPGHTPGHMVVEVSSEAEELLCTGDALIHPIHLEQPAWYSHFDMNRAQARRTARRILNRAASDSVMVFAAHFPFPGLGHIARTGEAWRWQALDEGST